MLFLPLVVLDFWQVQLSYRGRKEEGVGANMVFPGSWEGFEIFSVMDTRATTDKNDPFLNAGFKHGKKWVDKNGAKCNMGRAYN